MRERLFYPLHLPTPDGGGEVRVRPCGWVGGWHLPEKREEAGSLLGGPDDGRFSTRQQWRKGGVAAGRLVLCRAQEDVFCLLVPPRSPSLVVLSVAVHQLSGLTLCCSPFLLLRGPLEVWSRRCFFPSASHHPGAAAAEPDPDASHHPADVPEPGLAAGLQLHQSALLYGRPGLA